MDKRVIWGIWIVIVLAAFAIVAMTGAKSFWYAVVGVLGAGGSTMIGYLTRDRSNDRLGGRSSGDTA